MAKKQKKQNRIAVPEQIQRQIAAVNTLVAGAKMALNIPDNWGLSPDGRFFVGPKEE